MVHAPAPDTLGSWIVGFEMGWWELVQIGAMGLATSTVITTLVVGLLLYFRI